MTRKGTAYCAALRLIGLLGEALVSVGRAVYDAADLAIEMARRREVKYAGFALDSPL